jgi:hypothetical protein
LALGRKLGVFAFEISREIVACWYFAWGGKKMANSNFAIKSNNADIEWCAANCGVLNGMQELRAANGNLKVRG